MKKTYLIIFNLLLSVWVVSGQSVDAIKMDRQTYIWGEGRGSTLKVADQNALADIIGQLSVQVESSFQMSVSGDSDKTLKQTIDEVVKTYSNSTLKNTERIVLQNEPDAKVFRYIKRADISKIFNDRKMKILDLTRQGEEALENLKIADALRLFYWSQTLLRSHPDASNIKYSMKNGGEELLITWLPLQINNIFNNISVSVSSIEEYPTYNSYLLDIRYCGNHVRNFDYTYWGGQDWSNIVAAKDGLGIVEIAKNQLSSTIRIKAEYLFEGETNVDLELREVMEKVPEVSYRNSYLTINSTPQKGNNMVTESTATVAVKPNTVENKINETHLTLVESNERYETVMEKIIKAIKVRNYPSVENLFTVDGFGVFKELLQYGNAKILKDVELKYFQFLDNVVCRSVPMSFNFKTNNRVFLEDVVFYFDRQGKVCNVAFGLDKKAIEDIASNEMWNEVIRMQLINFMENYKTAYSLKRLDYIEKIFSDDALIITGRVTKVANISESQFFNNKIVRYNRQTKEQYLKKLKYSFAGNEYINLRFADNTVKQSGKSPQVFGIQIKQDYFSSSYGDSGYLFLLIDFTNIEAPQIHVRTWQPEKNPDGSIYGLTDF